MRARQHQRLPLLRLRIVRLRLCVKCQVLNLSAVALCRPVPRQMEKVNFLASTHDPSFLRLKPSLGHPGATLKFGDNRSSCSTVISVQTYIYRPT